MKNLIKTTVLALMLLTATETKAQQAIITKAPDGAGQFLRDTLMAISDTLTRDTVMVIKVQEFNKLYTYEIDRKGNLSTFTQLDKEKLWTNWKGIAGGGYFFLAWGCMIGHDNIKIDKVYHFAAGEVAGAGGYLIAKELGMKHPILWGILAGGAAGLGKEWIYDQEMGRGIPTIRDGAWTFIGGAFGAITAKAFTFKIPIQYKTKTPIKFD